MKANTNLVLQVDELKRNQRRIYKQRYKLQKNDSAVIGMHSPSLNKEGNKKYRATLLQASRANKITKDQLKSLCLSVTKEHT